MRMLCRVNGQRSCSLKAKYPAPFSRIQRPRQNCPDSKANGYSHRCFVVVGWYAKPHRTDSAFDSWAGDGTSHLARLNCPTARGTPVPILGRDTCRPKLPSNAYDGATRDRQHHRRPYRLIHSLRLPNKQRHRRMTTLTCVAPVGGHGTTRTPRAPGAGAPGPASRTPSCICTRRLCTARIYGHTYTQVGRRELAREWIVETD
jgi:hypothetical protein